ncbi:hypothetical protein N9O44_00560 [Gammaproteobacteria bacterium]|nr:hypothetical protein [Gammaproteobacteria bacterium]
MVVIKIGGSLQSTDYIKKWINAIRLNRSTSFLIIFGGGKYADNIRYDQKEKKYDDLKAHKLAIKGMTNFTEDILEDLKDFTVVNSIRNIKKNYKSRKLLVWMPSYEEVCDFNIPNNWDATSDSIALAISKNINAPLIVIKSVRFNYKKYINVFFLKENILDKYFSNNYYRSSQKISLVSREKYYKLNEICKDFLR